VVAVGRAGPELGAVGRSSDTFVQARRVEQMAEQRGGLGGGFCPLRFVHEMRGACGSKGQWHGGRQHAGVEPTRWRAQRLEQVERLDDAAAWRDAGGCICACARWKQAEGTGCCGGSGATRLAGCARARRSRAAQSASGAERREACGRRRGDKWLGAVLSTSLCPSERARCRSGSRQRGGGRQKRCNGSSRGSRRRARVLRGGGQGVCVRRLRGPVGAASSS
jgi:hypothetical protein